MKPNDGDTKGGYVICLVAFLSFILITIDTISSQRVNGFTALLLIGMLAIATSTLIQFVCAVTNQSD